MALTPTTSLKAIGKDKYLIEKKDKVDYNKSTVNIW